MGKGRKRKGRALTLRGMDAWVPSGHRQRAQQRRGLSWEAELGWWSVALCVCVCPKPLQHLCIRMCSSLSSPPCVRTPSPAASHHPAPRRAELGVIY